MKKLLIILLLISCRKEKEFIVVHDSIRIEVENFTPFAQITYAADYDTIYCSLSEGRNSIIVQKTKHLTLWASAQGGQLSINVLKEGHSILDTTLKSADIIYFEKYLYIGEF